MSKQAATYPTEEQYQRWRTQADGRDMSMSEWMECMIEAGQKKFDVAVEPDETNQELRDQRNDLREELVRARERIDHLEDRLVRGERGTIKEFIQANPGASYAEIVQHLGNTLPSRVTNHLDDLTGRGIRVDEGAYYPLEETD